MTKLLHNNNNDLMQKFSYYRMRETRKTVACFQAILIHCECV